MIRQYYAQHCQGGCNPLRVGVIAVGAIYYLQNDRYLRNPGREAPVCRVPWIVEGFLNGVCHAARRDPHTGQWLDMTMSHRSDMAVVRSLRDGRRKEVAVRTLQLHEDMGLWFEPTYYPPLPDLGFYRQRRQPCAICSRQAA